ncbi:MAG: CHASE domain-containing protein, partial [Zoogloea sp.]|uniref:CHASE domain-containing protein n=1 Tax=Zoogloea sp. TaxID=49181 RepID=UPI003F39AE60
MSILPQRITRTVDRSPAVFALVVMLAGAALSFTTWFLAARDARQTANAQFETLADRSVTVLQRRMVANEQILRGARALFDSNKGWVTREQWRAYVAGIKLDDNFPGIQGVGFSQRVEHKDLEKHTAGIRRDGFPQYVIRPDWDRPEYTSIIYLEPFWGRNLRAFGYDMMTEPVRREALEHARDTGETTLSGRVTLVQETNQDVQPGFLLYIPVYRINMPISTLEERRAALLGYVYSPFRARDLLSSLFAASADELGIEIYAGSTPSQDNLLYASVATNNASPAQHHTERQLNLNGATWTLKFSSQAAFERATQSQLPFALLAAGLTISCLMAWMVLTMSRTRNQATSIAQEMTDQFIRSEGRLKAVLDSAADGILTVDVRGRVETLNRSAEHIFGVASAAIAGHRLAELIDDLDIARIWHLLETEGTITGAGRSARLDATGRRATGESFPISVSLSELEVNAELRFSLIVRDVTDAKYAEAILRLRERVIESTSNGVVIAVTHIPGNPLMYVNPAFERITGYSADEAIGRNCSFLQGDDRDQQGLIDLRQAIAERRPTT